MFKILKILPILLLKFSGYKSTETRKDYSIDYKSESIYRQFTSAEGPNAKVPSAHPSIEEEEEEEEDDEEVIFV